MKLFPIHTCHFFNIFIHTDYIESNKGADLTIFNCPRESKATLSNPVGPPGCTPGFRVALNTIEGYRYFLEADAVLTTGKDAFLYIENCDGTKLISRTDNRFEPCRRRYYGVEFTALSDKTFVGILFFCSDVANVLRINQFRVSPYLDINNFVDANLEQWKCIGGQLGQPSGCTACTPDDCPPISELFAGPQGPPGSQGDVGAPGSFGNTGAQGAPGAQGAQGTVGEDGLQGSQGPQGSQGSQGPQGPPGSAGPIGLQGATGAQGGLGRQGITGPTGFQGSQGAQGLVGSQGSQGAQGVMGLQGSQGTTGSTGSTGATGPGIISGTWVTAWNTAFTSGGGTTTIEYQIISNVITIFIPGVDFISAGALDQIRTTTAMPAEIVPDTDQVFLTIAAVPASVANRTTVLSSGVVELGINTAGDPFPPGTLVNYPTFSGGPGTTLTYIKDSIAI